MGTLGVAFRMIRKSLTDMEKLFALQEQVPEVIDVEMASTLTVTPDTASIEFQNVSFGYDPSLPIIKNLSFSVKPRSKVAIVGESGAGKSTIARLIFRFFDISSGTILINGQDISQVTQSSLHHSIAVVPQDTVLFNDTLYFNVSYGNPTSTRDQVEKVVKAAQLDAFIDRQKKKYDTVVGERGLRLSGGEKQRVAIARALLKNAPIIILDEATSSLDSRTEQEIQSALTAVSKGRTSVVIAHRLSTIMDADLILVLDGGIIVERVSVIV